MINKIAVPRSRSDPRSNQPREVEPTNSSGSPNRRRSATFRKLSESWSGYTN